MIKKASPTFDIETEIADSFYPSPLMTHNKELVIAGIDEAGRGPLCGPVVAGAVIFPSYEIVPPVLITDSKQMTHAQRAAAYDWITQNTTWAVGSCNPAEIDELNILWASMLAMKRAILGLSTCPDFCLVDGNRLPDNLINASQKSSMAPSGSVAQGVGCPIMGRAIVKGDARSLSIAAASIIAKETRDKTMHDLAQEFPHYGWERNAGYPTAAHLQAIEKYGINEHYRKTFRPIKERIQNETA